MKTKSYGIIVVILTIAGLATAYQLHLFNRPPTAGFSWRTAGRIPKYLNPTTDDLLTFHNESSDPDRDPLTYTWFVNGELKSRNTDFQTQLLSGTHTVLLVASDGRAQNAKEARIRVEPGSAFLSKALKIPIKGINYRIDKAPPPQEIEECIECIRKELGCNGIIINGGYEDLILAAAETAIQKGFQEIILSPRYEMTQPRNESFHIEDHIRRIGSFAKRAQELLERTRAPIILCVGEELHLSVVGIMNVSTYIGRIDEARRIGVKNLAAIENEYLARIIREARKGFSGRITYKPSQAMSEYMRWDSLDVDILAPMMYFGTKWYTENGMLKFIDSLKHYGKPVYVSEFGCATYLGASLWGGGGWSEYTNQTYSEEEQAENIHQTIEIFQKAQVQAVYLWDWMDYVSPEGPNFSVVRYFKNGPYDRKLSFYMYKSFTVEQQLTYKTISVADAKAMIESNPSLSILDVRTTQEYAQGRLKDAVNIPLSDLLRRIGELEKNRPILVYCQTGNRSAQASSILLNQGFTSIYIMEGGLTAWINFRYPTVTQ